MVIVRHWSKRQLAAKAPVVHANTASAGHGDASSSHDREQNSTASGHASSRGSSDGDGGRMEDTIVVAGPAEASPPHQHTTGDSRPLPPTPPPVQSSPNAVVTTAVTSLTSTALVSPTIHGAAATVDGGGSSCSVCSHVQMHGETLRSSSQPPSGPTDLECGNATAQRNPSGEDRVAQAVRDAARAMAAQSRDGRFDVARPSSADRRRYDDRCAPMYGDVRQHRGYSGIDSGLYIRRSRHGDSRASQCDSDSTDEDESYGENDDRQPLTRQVHRPVSPAVALAAADVLQVHQDLSHARRRRIRSVSPPDAESSHIHLQQASIVVRRWLSVMEGCMFHRSGISGHSGSFQCLPGAGRNCGVPRPVRRFDRGARGTTVVPWR